MSKKTYKVDLNAYNNYLQETGYNRPVTSFAIPSSLSMSNKYDYTLKPDGYGIWEWSKDAFTTFQQNMFETGLESSLGKL